MYSESDLEAAVAGGALSPDAAARFRNFVAAGQHSPAVDEEHFRLLTGFNDIFVSIAAVILLFAVGWIGYYVPPHIDGDGPTPFMGLFVAITAWGLAEYFTRQRRMALPSIILLLAFVGGVGATAVFTMVTAIGPDFLDHNGQASAIVLAAGAAIAAAAAWLHWRRFKVPITVAAGAAAVVALVLGLIAAAFVTDPETMSEQQVETMKNVILAAALVLGIGTFLLAMRWDASDPRRETRRSDVAFWLHLLAAPLIVHPVFTLLGLLAGLDRPSTGSVYLDGQELGSLNEDDRARLRGEKIGFVFQAFQLIPTLTAKENIQVPLELQGNDGASERGRR